MFYIEEANKAIEELEKAKKHYEKVVAATNNKAKELYGLRKGGSVAINNVDAYLTLLANVPQNYKQDVSSVQEDIKDFKDAVETESTYSANAMTVATTYGLCTTKSAIQSMIGSGVNLKSAEFGLLVAAAAVPSFWFVGLSMLFSIIPYQKYKQAKEELSKLTPVIADWERRFRELQYLILETEKLLPAIDISKVLKGFPFNYYEFNDEQKKKLATLINSTQAFGELINKRIA